MTQTHAWKTHEGAYAIVAGTAVAIALARTLTDPLALLEAMIVEGLPVGPAGLKTVTKTPRATYPHLRTEGSDPRTWLSARSRKSFGGIISAELPAAAPPPPMHRVFTCPVAALRHFHRGKRGSRPGRPHPRLAAR